MSIEIKEVKHKHRLCCKYCACGKICRHWKGIGIYMNQHKFSFNKLFWGMLFIAGAAFLLADRMGYWSEVHSVTVVGILFTIFFIWMVLQGIYYRNFFMILFGLSFIAIQYRHPLGITSITPWTLLSAALLASIGLTIIFPAKKFSKNGNFRNFEFADKGERVFEEQDGEVIHYKSTFGECVKYINTDALVNVQLENTFGEMKIFFDNAVIKNGVADVNISNSFGETILYIPKTWNVENHVKSSFGEIKFEGLQTTQGCPTLRIYGSVSFGEVKVVFI